MRKDASAPKKIEYNMPYEKIEFDQIQTLPLSERKSFINIETAKQDPLADVPEVSPMLEKQIDKLADSIKLAKKTGATVSLCYGAHLIKNGGATLVNWLIENDWIDHVATQGAGIIHDWEFAFAGVSSESVEQNAPVGKFGSWSETGSAINSAVTVGAGLGLGFGESIGKMISEGGIDFPHPAALLDFSVKYPEHDLAAAKLDLFAFMERFEIMAGFKKIDFKCTEYSVPAKCYEKNIPMTVHPGIGYDIYTNHPMFSPAAIGRAAGIDARIFAEKMLHLTKGVYLSVGSAIMSPQVFEKAFSLANNVKHQQDGTFIKDHYIGIVDIQDGGGWDWSQGEPPKDHPAYYLRFCKSFYRMGGTIDYICCDNCAVLKNLIARLK